MALDPALKAVIARINKKQGEGTVVLGSEITVPLIDTITTGSLNVDAAMGGGWAVNHFNEIIGNPSAGKTLVTLKTIAANQARDPSWMTVWFASEDFHEPYARMMGVDLDRVAVVEENVMELVYEMAIDFLRERSVDCMVIDSLPALVPSREDEKTMEDFQPGLGAFLTNKFFRKANPLMKRPLLGAERSVTGIVINQWRSKITQFGDPRTTPGGMGKDFFYFQRCEVRRDDWIDNTRGQHIGQTIKVLNVKNKLAPPGRQGFVDAYIDKGNGFEPGEYDLVKDIISAAIAYGVIDAARGGKYSFGDTHWQGRPRLDAAIREDARLRGSIRKAVLKATALPDPPSPQPIAKVKRGSS